MILVTGATSQVGIVLLERLKEAGARVRCLVRKSSNIEDIKHSGAEIHIGDVEDAESLKGALKDAEYVVHIAGIWRAEHILEACKQSQTVKKIIFIGSTSRFTKLQSVDAKERELAHKMAKAENQIAQSTMKTVILRPTMLYGIDKDKNILQIIGVMNKYGFYPRIGRGEAYKHPVYVGDVVSAILLCLYNNNIIKNDYVIAGRTPILYKDMLNLIKSNLNKRVFIIPTPVWAAYAGLWLYRLLKRGTYINYAMIKRVNEDISYDISPAVRDFGYNPVSFAHGLKKQIVFLREKGLL